MVNDLWWSEDPLVQYVEALQLLRYLTSQQACELRHCYYSHCSNGQLRHEENMVEALLNGQVNLQLAATKTGHQSAKIVPYLRSSAGLETASRFLVTAPISNEFRLPSQLTSGKHLTAPAKAAVTLRLDPSKKHQSHKSTTTFTKRLMGGSKSLKIKGLNPFAFSPKSLTGPGAHIQKRSFSTEVAKPPHPYRK